VDGAKTKYINDVGLGLVQVLMETTDEDTVLATYNYGNDLISSINHTLSTINYFHYDGLGTVRQLTDDAEAVVAEYTYEAFGTLIASTGATTNAYGFTGEQQFGEADNLVFLRARYYDSRIGRFISRDPIGYRGGINLYVYCDNNPINLIDPYGKMGVVGSIISIPPGVSKWLKGVQLFACSGCLGCLAGTEIGCIGTPNWDECVRDTLKDYWDDVQEASSNPGCATGKNYHSLACVGLCAACIPNLFPTFPGLL